jgi:DNA-binding response OmpR family regulator
MDVAKKRVLIVDDDEQIVEAVQMALEQGGYEVLTARDGAEGLMRAERDEPDLILLDVVLPKRSGFTVLDHLRRSRFRSTPIIMLTANDEQRHRDFAATRGADAFITKPFDMCELLSEIDTLLKV